MKTKITKCLVILLTGFLLSYSFQEGWIKAGSQRDKYEMGEVKDPTNAAKYVLSIRSTAEEIKGFGTLMKTVDAGIYKGKRIRLQGEIKLNGVSGWTGFWCRVDQAGSPQPLAFDNMQDRPISGTADWTSYYIVLDVPQNAARVAFGTLLTGKGQVWFRNLKLQTVDLSINTTKP